MPSQHMLRWAFFHGCLVVPVFFNACPKCNWYIVGSLEFHSNTVPIPKDIRSVIPDQWPCCHKRSGLFAPAQGQTSSSSRCSPGTVNPGSRWTGRMHTLSEDLPNCSSPWLLENAPAAILSERGTHVGDCPGGHIKACQRIGKSHGKTWKKLQWNTGIPHFQKLGDDKDSRVTWHNMMMQSSGYQLCSKGLGHRLKPRSSLTNRNCCSKPNCMKTSGTYKFPIKPSNVQSSDDREKKNPQWFTHPQG